jgi:hypothetical protein
MSAAMTPAYGFPCNADKTPRLKEWQRKLFQWQPWTFAELVGAQTGSANGFDILDVDTYKAAGAAWYDANKNKLPITRVHETRQGGKHFFFRHAPGLRGSEGRIAKGVDVRADGNFVIWWPRERYPVDDLPIADWPAWLLEEARGKNVGFRSYPTRRKVVEGVVEVEGATATLREIDPCVFNGEGELWFNFMMGCRAVGIGVDDFVGWSTQDPDYAGDGEIIRTRWNSATVFHGGAFYAQSKASGIKLAPHKPTSPHEPTGVLPGRVRLKTRQAPSPQSLRPHASHWLARVKGLRASLRRDQCEASLFSYACLYAEILYEEGKASADAFVTAQNLLEEDCPKLIREIGIDAVRRSIRRAFEHKEQKA